MYRAIVHLAVADYYWYNFPDSTLKSLSAHQLKSGEYVIFLEDDYKAKVVIYRWNP